MTEPTSGATLQRLQTLFAQLVELPEAARTALLDAECADAPQLRAELEALLAADQQLVGSTVRTPLQALPMWSEAAEGDPLLGAQLGPYRLRALLGAGGMGRVYRAERVDGLVQQEVAIKVLQRATHDPGLLQRFLHERRTLARLDHPHIARLLDAAALADGTPYVVMACIHGEPITTYCRTQGLDLQARLSVFLKVCGAVSHAHRQLVVHRDLKPGNILVTADGEPHLLDFGIAKTLQEGASEPAPELTRTGERWFSPRYAAPEQLAGDPIAVTCDVHALGLLLYELLAGQGPHDWTGLRWSAMEALVLHAPTPPPSARCLPRAQHPVQAATLRGDLDAIVLRCLRKPPADRYASVEQLEADVRAYLQGRPVLARPGTRSYRLRKFCARHRWKLLGAASVLLGLLVVALLLLAQNRALQRERDRSQAALALLQEAFIAADPLRHAGVDLRARDVLDAARDRVQALQASQPELYVHLAPTLAELDLAVGRFREAAALYQQLLTMPAAEAVGRDQRAAWWIRRARAAFGQRAFAEARMALQAARALGGERHPEWALAMSGVLAADQPLAVAIALLQGHLDQAALPTPDPAQVHEDPRALLRIEVWLALVELHRLAGEPARALAQLDQLLAWQSVYWGPTHPLRLRSALRRPSLLRETGEAALALQESQALTTQIEAQFGLDSPAAAYAQASLGISLKAAGRTTEAIVAHQLAATRWSAALGPDHSNTLRSRFNLANALQAFPDRVGAAEAHYRDVLARSEAQVGSTHHMSLFYRLHLARLLLRQQRVDETLALIVALPPVAWWQQADATTRSSYGDTLRGLQALAGCDGLAVYRPAAESARRCTLLLAWRTQAGGLLFR